MPVARARETGPFDPDRPFPASHLVSSECISSPLIDVGTAVRVTGTNAPTVVGDSAVVAIDASRATFATGTNGAIGASWLLLDAFAAGDAVAP